MAEEVVIVYGDGIEEYARVDISSMTVVSGPRRFRDLWDRLSKENATVIVAGPVSESGLSDGVRTIRRGDSWDAMLDALVDLDYDALTDDELAVLNDPETRLERFGFGRGDGGRVWIIEND